jgi:hypothetical protein
MVATDEQIEKIAVVLAKWNPLGAGASEGGDRSRHG